MPPKVGAGLRFDDRIGSYAVSTAGPVLPATNVSFEGWVLARHTGSTEGAFYGIGATNGYALIIGGTGALSFLFEGVRYISAGGVTLVDGGLYHLTVVVTGSGAATVTTFYVDGVQVAQNTGTAPTPGAAGWTLGAMSGGSGRRSRSTVYGLRVWTRALTAAEAADAYAGRPVDRTGLVLDLAVDEGFGSKVYDRADKGRALRGGFATAPIVDGPVGRPLEIRVRLVTDDWTPTGSGALFFTNGPGARLQPDGTVWYYRSGAPSAPGISLAALPTGVPVTVRFRDDGATVAVDWSLDELTWTFAGSFALGGGLPALGALYVGSQSNGSDLWNGTVQRASIRPQDSWTPTVEIDFTKQLEGTRAFVASSGQTVTLAAAATLDSPVYDGVLVGGPTWLQRKAERGVLVGPGSSGVTVPSAQGIPNPSRRKLTLVYWNRALGAALGGSGTRPVQVFGTNFAVFAQGATARVDTTTINQTWTTTVDAGADGWQHVALTVDMDAALVSHYVNGGGVSSRAIVAPGDIPALLGLSVPSGGWNVTRDVAVFGRVLSLAEIRAIALGADPLSFADCFAHLPLENDSLNRAPVGRRQKNLFARIGLDVDVVSGGWTTGNSTTDLIATTLLPVPAIRASRKIGQGTGDINLTSYYAATIPATPGVRYSAAVEAASLDGVDRTVTFTLRNQAFAFLGTLTTTVDDKGWKRLVVSGVAPAGTTSIHVSVNGIGFVEGASFDTRRRMLVEGADPGRFVPASEYEPAPAVHGIDTNGPRPVRPRSREGLRMRRALVANTDFVTIPHHPDLELVGDMAFAVWALSDVAATQSTLIGKRLGGDAPFFVRLSVTSLDFFVANASAFPSVTANVTPTADQRWHLWSGSKSGLNVFLYRDGVPIGSGVLSGQGAAAGATLQLGARGMDGTESYEGTLGACRLWNRPLTADEHAALMGDVVPRSGLVGEWLRDAVVGTVALDSSGYGRNGVVSGGAVAA